MTIELRTAGARALLEPGYGGRLHQLFIEVEGAEHPLLVAPESPDRYAADPLFGGSYPMAPWPNRIRDGAFPWRISNVGVGNGREHALHGLVLDQPWDIVARVGRVVEMSCPLGPGWPWEGSCWQRFELGAGYLAMKMEVRSSREAFPAGCGWHPWFLRSFAGSRDVRISLAARHRYEMGENLPTGRLVAPEGTFLLDGRPLGERQLDDCYAGLDPATVTLDWPRLSLTVSVASPEPHVQVYATSDALCVEPQTCAPDAFNLAGRGVSGSGVAVVEPGRPLGLQCRWEWKTR